MFLLLSALICNLQIEMLDIVLPRLSKEHIDIYINNGQMQYDQSWLNKLTSKNALIDRIIELISILRYYGIDIIGDYGDGDMVRELMLDGDQGKGKYRAYIDGEYPPYIPPNVKQKVLITTELIRKTPGNYMHLLPNELAREVYSHL